MYSYPIARAYKDKMFGQITFLPVDAPPNAADNDVPCWTDSMNTQAQEERDDILFRQLVL